MIGAGGLLHLLNAGVRIPDDIGLAGFNGVELLHGLPMQLATMDACRVEIGERAAQIVADRVLGNETKTDSIVELSPVLGLGTLLEQHAPNRHPLIIASTRVNFSNLLHSDLPLFQIGSTGLVGIQ